MKLQNLIIGYFSLIALCTACQQNEKIFQIITSENSGIDFVNRLEINDSINGLDFEYVYNGAGVAIGDVNNDGWQDVFLAGNMVSSRLYLNTGSLVFEDVTAEAGVETNRWCTGTSMVDINDDGLLDIYICVAGLGQQELRKNIFLIHQGFNAEGIPLYKDMAEEMGLGDEGYSTMAVFFDYDKDQDLDVYILTNAMEAHLRNALRPRRVNGEGPSNDRFYINDGNGHFRNYTREAGILQEGYGLGVGIGDINQDGWMDVYCANDFLSNDLLWINNRDGTFSEESGQYFKHFTSNGMGMDIGDYNNDGLLDIIVLDMLPEANQRQKQMIGYRNLTRFYESLTYGYHPQYLRNTLQLNRGQFDDGKYRFSEISYLAGIHQTDWSWSPLLADYNNDGWKDLSITNGYRKDVTNLDYIQFVLRDTNMFGTENSKKQRKLDAMNELPDVKLNNFLFGNNRDLTFTDRSEEWGMDLPTFTNGTAYADLDNDGDLDIVVNNIDQEAMLYENLTSDKGINHFLKLKFAPEIHDYLRIGSKAWIFHDGNQQFYEYSPYRGYKSTVGSEILIGLGSSTRVDSLFIQWPDGWMEKWVDIPSDTVLSLAKDKALQYQMRPPFGDLKSQESIIWFEDRTRDYSLEVFHRETSALDLNKIPIILHNLGQYGPGIAAGDLNSDGLDDLYVGNDSDIPGTLLIQQEQGNFQQKSFALDSVYEDLGSLFIDVDDDGDQDLYIVSGGSNWEESDPRYQDRLYINDGQGHFSRSEQALPDIRSSGSCVTACDYDLDGDLDLFVGGRLVPGKYPTTPKSYLLENENGRFLDVSNILGGEKGFLGMVTAALWTDINLDGRPDLFLVGEYMPLTVLINYETGFRNETKAYNLENTPGWWNSINGADLDNDGDIDYVIGNYGLNSFFKPSQDRPVELYASDYDRNGSIDPITTVYIQEESYIFHPRNLMIDQIPSFGRRFETFEEYSTTPFIKSFTKEEIEAAIHLECKMLQSVILEKEEGTSFRLHHLPLQAQFAPVFGISFHDFNGDEKTDVLLVGNSYAEETVYGYYDASYGSMLINRGNFDFEVLENNRINLVADGDKKALAQMNIGGDMVFVTTENNGPLKAYQLANSVDFNTISLEKDDWYAMLSLRDGTQKRVEFYHGSGYLSQHSRIMSYSGLVKSIFITKYGDKKREAL